jgi:hypothetical protein
MKTLYHLLNRFSSACFDKGGLIGLLFLVSIAGVHAQQFTYDNYNTSPRPKGVAAGKPGTKQKESKKPVGGFSTNSLTTGAGDDIRLWPSNNHQSEVHISIDKTNPCNLVASANTYTDENSQGYYYSTDGGNTWQGSDDMPNNSDSSGDPSTAYDASGNAYIAGMLETNHVEDGYFIQRSANKGTSWSNQTRAAGPAPNFDKEMIAADDVPTSPFANNLYAAWTDFSTYTVRFNRSTNQGTSYSQPITLLNGSGQGANVQTGPNGEVYVCWADYRNSSFTGLGFVRSTDGGATFTAPTVPFNYTSIRVNNTSSVFNHTRTNDFPAMAVDKSNVHRGRIYVTYPTKNGNGNAIVQVRFSDNQGATWSAPINVSLAYINQSWFPWITVDDVTGDVSVIYYGMGTANTSQYNTATYVAYSTNGGGTFTNLMVSDVGHITAPIDDQRFAQGYAGDYLGITAHGGKVYPVWSDNRTGIWQLYTSPITTYSISGPDVVCTSSSVFQTTTSVNWTASPSYLFSNTSGTGTQFSTAANAGQSGTGTITATLPGPCGGIVFTKDVQVGEAMSANYYVPATGTGGSLIPWQYGDNGVDDKYCTVRFYDPNQPNATYTFSADPSSNYTYQPNGYELDITFRAYSPGYYQQGFTVTKTGGTCGSVSEYYVIGYYYYSYSYAVSPNPASSQLTVTRTNETAPVANTSNTQLASAVDNASSSTDEVEATLYDNFGQLRKKVKISHDKETFDIYELPDGLYTLRIGQGKGAVVKHIQIQH